MDNRNRRSPCSSDVRIRLWLLDLRLPQYADAFEANHIDEESLPLVNDQALKDIGVASAGHRLRILASIADFNAHRHDAPRAAVGDTLAQSDDGERRQATVLFVDISGFTTLCSQLDPELVQALLNRFFEVADGTIVGYGGYVIDHAGDGIFAAFGAPVAHDNDAERSVRAVLDIHSKTSAINDPTGKPLALHAGIASGEVVAATIVGGARPKYSLTGDAVNLAARLGSMAQSGQTLIADSTWHPVSRHFDATPLGETQVKGINRPVLLWSLIGPRHTAAERRPFVGRHTEMRQLAGVLDAVKDGQGQSVCVRGEAGIGKSRLVEHFLDEARSHGFECHTGSVLDFGVGKRQDALAAIIEDVLGLGIQADEAAVQAAVQTAVSNGLITADEHVLINDLLELAQTAEQQAAFDAMDNQTRMQRMGETFASLVQRAALKRPQVILVEDIHWASTDLLRHLALLAHMASESRIVLLMTSRFEAYPLDSAWRASSRGSALMTVDLGPLRSHECRLLAAAFVRSPEGVLSECIARADGNPLFLEQLLRNAAESQVSNLPASIQSLVLARLVGNAVRHTGDGEEVVVAVSRTGDGRARLSVTDRCGGIAPESLPRVFDMGWRAEPERSGTGAGAGLGLTIAKGIVDRHDGEITVRNVPGGCRFDINLPAAPES